MPTTQPSPPAETRFEIDTELGSVWLHGRNTGKPILLVIAGLFAPSRYAGGAQAAFPHLDVLRCQLPGWRCPGLVSTSIGVFAAAYSEALTRVAEGRPTMIHGHSAGGLIGLAMREPGLRRKFILEPPLRTGDLWPLHELRHIGPPGWEKLTWPILGLDAARHEARDYIPMLDGLTTPTTVVIGSEPLLPPRELPEPPSFVDATSRQVLSRHKMVQLIEVPGVGHRLPSVAAAVTIRLARLAVAAAFPETPACDEPALDDHGRVADDLGKPMAMD
jgi:hypothetical protein